MRSFDQHDLLTRVIALRTQTFELLDELVPAASHGDQNPDLSSSAVRLQHVANELGWVERSLTRPEDRAA